MHGDAEPVTVHPTLSNGETGISNSGEIGDFARGTRQLEDVQAGVRAVDDVDVSAVVHLDVVGLDRHLATLVRASANAPPVGLARHSGDVIPDFLRVEWIADVEDPHPRVEMRDEQHTLVVDRREILVRGMRAEAPAPAAEIAARL